MNERIKEVMDETDSWCDKNFPSDWLNRVDEFLPLWNEKFAELIVRECAGIYSKIDNGNQHLGTDDYLEALQKHFGVKE